MTRRITTWQAEDNLKLLDRFISWLYLHRLSGYPWSEEKMLMEAREFIESRKLELGDER